MQQRRLRLGDILDDYCPRERRITNHAVVAMIEDEVKQTRCTTCDADHEYKQARIPVRRKKEGALVSDTGIVGPRPRAVAAVPADHDEHEEAAHEDLESTPAATPVAVPAALSASDHNESDTHTDSEPKGDAEPNEDGPVHRRLIRATLPRPEGQAPEWKNPDFTIRQPGGSGRGGGGFDSNRNGHRPASRGGRRPGARTQGSPQGQPSRFGGQRQGNARSGSSQPSGQGNRSGGRSGQGHGQGQGQGQHRGQRQGGHGRKRGR
jgi:hypothetical protein